MKSMEETDKVLATEYEVSILMATSHSPMWNSVLQVGQDAFMGSCEDWMYSFTHLSQYICPTLFNPDRAHVEGSDILCPRRASLSLVEATHRMESTRDLSDLQNR